MLKSQRYGGGLRWHCTDCDAKSNVIRWTNSKPPLFCTRCAGKNLPELVKVITQKFDIATVKGRLSIFLFRNNLVPYGVSSERLAASIRLLLKQRNEHSPSTEK